jgi:hypothetical protein
MAAKSFLRRVAGGLADALGIQTSSGVANAGDIPALDDTGRLDITMMPVGVAAEAKDLPSSENLTAGNLVNIWNDAGTLKVRRADGTTAGKEANGFVLDSVTTPDTVTVHFEGTNTAVAGLTPGTWYYLSTTPGGVTATPLEANGNLSQRVGKATAATELWLELGEPITVTA